VNNIKDPDSTDNVVSDISDSDICILSLERSGKGKNPVTICTFLRTAIYTDIPDPWENMKKEVESHMK